MVFGNFMNFKIYDNIQSITIQQQQQALIEDIRLILSPSTTPHWSINAIIEDIRLILNSFVCWNASFVFRDSNYVAHSLAQWAYFCNSFGSPPLSVVSRFLEGGVGQFSPLPLLLFVSAFILVLIYCLIQQKKKQQEALVPKFWSFLYILNGLTSWKQGQI